MKWIDIKKESPPIDEVVLLYGHCLDLNGDFCDFFTGFLDLYKEWNSNMGGDIPHRNAEITHWMPLPKPPLRKK